MSKKWVGLEFILRTVKEDYFISFVFSYNKTPLPPPLSFEVEKAKVTAQRSLSQDRSDTFRSINRGGETSC